MKKLMLLLMLMCISSGMSAQRYATVKREGGFTNIRRGPGTGYAIVKKERDGNGIYVGSNVGGWYEVYSGPNGGFVGYISSNKVVFGGSSYNRPQKTYNTGSNLMRVRVKTASSGAIDLGKENPFHPDELNSDGFHNSQIKPSVQFIII